MGLNVIFRRAGEQRVWRDGDGAPAELAAHAPSAAVQSIAHGTCQAELGENILVLPSFPVLPFNPGC